MCLARRACREPRRGVVRPALTHLQVDAGQERGTHRSADGRMHLGGAARQGYRKRPEPLHHGVCEARELHASAIEDPSRHRVGIRRRRDCKRQPPDLAPVAAVDRRARERPIGAAQPREHILRKGRVLPGAGPLVFMAPDMPQCLARDPEAAAAVVEDRAASAGAMQYAPSIDVRRDGTRARVDDMPLAWVTTARAFVSPLNNVGQGSIKHDRRSS